MNNTRRWIFILAVIAGTLLAATYFPAHGLSVQDKVITLSDEDVAECIEGGGCVLVTREKLWKAIEEQVQKLGGSCAMKTSKRS